MYKFTAQGCFETKSKTKESFTNNTTNVGEYCRRHNECTTNFCFVGKCAYKTRGNECINNIECKSNQCVDKKCV
jgi:hypothetical protein